MTTARQAYQGLQAELSKVNAPSILLHEFNYIFNKAIQQCVNKQYGIYDTNQQTTDALRVLKTTAVFDKPSTANDKLGSLIGSRYEVELPDDYLHMLNCTCIFDYKSSVNNCESRNGKTAYGAKRLTADSWAALVSDYYSRPTPRNPYYYINNVNKEEEIPTNIYRNGTGTDQSPSYTFPTLFQASGGKLKTSGEESENLRNNPAYNRHANASKVRCEIRCGELNDKVLDTVIIEYLKAPQTINLTKQQLDLVEDTSQILEFPDYFCQEIINEVTMLVMAKTSDPRLQTQIATSQSIANPQQAQPTQQS